MHGFRELRQRRDPVIGGQSHPHVGHTYLMAEEVEELRQAPVEFKRHAPHLWRVWTNLVPENIVGREADCEKVRCRARSELLVYDKFLGKFQLVIVGERSGAHHFVETAGRAIFAVSRCR